MCQVHWIEKILVIFFSLYIFLMWWLILLPWLPVQMPQDKGMGMSLWSLEGKRRSRIDVQGRTSLSTSYDLLEKPFYRAFVEVERASGESPLVWLLWEPSVNQTDGGQGSWVLCGTLSGRSNSRWCLSFCWVAEWPENKAQYLLAFWGHFAEHNQGSCHFGLNHRPLGKN